jgi:glycogen debranching enzyme
VADANDWQSLELDIRQELVRKFITTNNAELREQFIAKVRAPKGYGIFASTGPNYQSAIFGRDSIEVAEDLLKLMPELAKEIILSLASLQGKLFTHTNEEEPGKIHHEYRSRHWNGQPAPHAAQIVFDHLKDKWGGSDQELRYYGSYDASALFVRLVGRYCHANGEDILDHAVTSYDQTKLPLRDHVRQAALWVATRVTASPWKLFEYQRLNPKGIFHQSWEDSDMAYIHTDGTVAQADTGLAAIEIQGYAYDALLAAADLVARSPEEAAAWRDLAGAIQAQTQKELWMEKEHYFAMGLDRDPEGKPRQIQTLNLNAGLLLESNLLHNLSDDQRHHYLENLAYTIFSEDFLTPAGLRLRAKRHADLVKFADYHGCEVTWPKQTFDIAKGLRAHGLPLLADLLEACILHSVTEAGEFYEFFFVDPNGQPKYHYRNERSDEPTFHEFGAANMPDPGQAWTISAVLSIVAARHSHQHADQPADGLQDDVFNQPHVQNVAKAIGFKVS